MRRAFAAFAGLGFVALPLSALAQLSTGRAQVSQSGVQYSVAPLDGRTNAAAFYSYGVPNASCANTGLETPTISLVFLYQDTTQNPAPLSLFTINDQAGNAAGGTANFTFTGLPVASNYVVQDDDYDGYINFPPIGGVTTAQWSWGTCCTDGAAIDGLDTEPFCVAIQPQFLGGIRNWQLLSGPDAAAPVRHVLPSMTDTLYICGDCLEMTCPTSVVADCTGPGVGYVSLFLPARSLCGGEIITNDHTGGGADASGDYPMGSTDVVFNMVDAGGFTASCTTTVTVQDTRPPDIITCPPPLTLDCAGAAGVPVTDPRIQAWLATFDARDACGPATLTNDAPSAFTASCLATRTTVNFFAVDDLGHQSSCSSTVTLYSQCLALPPNVGAALRVGNHGDPHAADITATLNWTLDEGLPRPADQHYHVRRGTSPTALSQVLGTEPWVTLTYDDSTPAGTTLPFVHYYSLHAAGPCDDQSTD